MTSSILLALSTAVLTLPANSSLPVAQLEQAVQTFVAAKHVPGVQVAVRDQDGQRWSAGFGWSDLENKVLVTPQTSFRLASVSKTLTSAAVMRLAEQGKIDLDKEIQTYCPAFPVKPWPITVRQLLNHTAGVRHYKDDAEYNSTKAYASVVDGLSVFKDDPLLFQPGTKFFYSTFGYCVLGCAVEGASGKDFGAALEDLVLAPAGMTATRIDSVHDLIPHRALGYVLAADGKTITNSDLADTSYKIPGGGIVATADDLVSFGASFLAPGFLRTDTVQAMWSLQTPGTGEAEGYGLGWILGTRNGLREVFHTGAQQRVSTVVYLLPDEGRVVAVFANLEDAESLDLARQLADVLAGRHAETLERFTRPWFERIKS
jgi:CubicO group peptidase (beta-lactamase class C family)